MKICKFQVAALALIGAFHSASAQDANADRSGGFLLGISYFEQLCKLSIGKPEQFRKLVEASDLRKMSAEEYAKISSPQGLEGWVRSEGNVNISVEYTRTMACLVNVSHAREGEVRVHVEYQARKEAQKGKTVRLVRDETVSSPGIPPYKVIQFHVYSPDGNFALIGITSAESYQGREAVFYVGPFR
jgi:hypothetical protein